MKLSKRRLRKILISELKRIKEKEQTVVELNGVDNNSYYVSPRDIKYIAPAEGSGFSGLFGSEHLPDEQNSKIDHEHYIFIMKPGAEVMGRGEFSNSHVVAENFQIN